MRSVRAWAAGTVGSPAAGVGGGDGLGGGDRVGQPLGERPGGTGGHHDRGVVAPHAGLVGDDPGEEAHRFLVGLVVDDDLAAALAVHVDAAGGLPGAHLVLDAEDDGAVGLPQQHLRHGVVTGQQRDPVRFEAGLQQGQDQPLGAERILVAGADHHAVAQGEGPQPGAVGAGVLAERGGGGEDPAARHPDGAPAGGGAVGQHVAAVEHLGVQQRVAQAVHRGNGDGQRQADGAGDPGDVLLAGVAGDGAVRVGPRGARQDRGVGAGAVGGRPELAHGHLREQARGGVHLGQRRAVHRVQGDAVAAVLFPPGDDRPDDHGFQRGRGAHQ